MKIIDSGMELTEVIIDKFEKELGIVLPEDYRQFMLKNNGGTPEEDFLFDYLDVVTNCVNNSCIRVFFIIYDGETNNYDDLLRIYQIMREEQVLESIYLPIADDPGENPICMCVGKDNYGKIYYCDHEFEDPVTGYLAMSEIAGSFSELLDKLYIEQ